MANPTFDGTALTTDAAAERIGAPAARVYVETMPNATGEFVQTGACGGRDISVTGLYEGTPAATILDAHAALKGALRAVQAKVGGPVRTYIGADGWPYAACVLTSYQPAGALRYVRVAGNYRAVVRVQAVVRDLNP